MAEWWSVLHHVSLLWCTLIVRDGFYLRDKQQNTHDCRTSSLGHCSKFSSAVAWHIVICSVNPSAHGSITITINMVNYSISFMSDGALVWLFWLFGKVRFLKIRGILILPLFHSALLYLSCAFGGGATFHHSRTQYWYSLFMEVNILLECIWWFPFLAV